MISKVEAYDNGHYWLPQVLSGWRPNLQISDHVNSISHCNGTVVTAMLREPGLAGVPTLHALAPKPFDKDISRNLMWGHGIQLGRLLVVVKKGHDFRLNPICFATWPLHRLKEILVPPPCE